MYGIYEPKQCKSHSRSENKNVKVASKFVELANYFGCDGYRQRRVICSECGYDKTFIYPANG